MMQMNRSDVLRRQENSTHHFEEADQAATLPMCIRVQAHLCTQTNAQYHQEALLVKQAYAHSLAKNQRTPHWGAQCVVHIFPEEMTYSYKNIYFHFLQPHD